MATVLILLAVGVAAALAAFMVAWQSVDGQHAWRSYDRARGLADRCAERARSALWDDPAYPGSESFMFGSDRCSVLPIVAASLSREVLAEGYAGDTVSRTVVTYELTLDASGSVQTIGSVREGTVAEFRDFW